MLQPNFFVAETALAESLYLYGDYESAKAEYNNLNRKYPARPALRIQELLSFPHILESNEYIDKIRQEFFGKLEKMLAENLRINGFEEPITMPFYQGYHARNNKELMEKLAMLFKSAWPELCYVSANSLRKIEPGQRPLRVGFISKFFHKHAISDCYDQVIRKLAEDKDFEIFIFAFNAKNDERTENLKRVCKTYVTLGVDLSLAWRQIEKEEPDILIYTDLGIDIITYLLAYSRLAPIQCSMAGGHPVTSGLSTIDYVLSAKIFEPENASEHYTEKLVLFDGMPEVLDAPTLPKSEKNRAEMELPQDKKLYLCPVRLFRIHPDMDPVFAQILARDPEAIILLIESDFKNLWQEKLEKRLRRTIPENLLARIKFIPFARDDDFMNLLKNVDVLLDPFHFSLGTTLFRIFVAGLPIVTLAGEFMRGRGALAHYTQIGIIDLIAYNKEEYVELALRLAHDSEFSDKIKNRIKENAGVIFDDFRPVEDLKKFLQAAI